MKIGRKIRMRNMATSFEVNAHKLVDRLSETAGWDKLIYHAAVCQ